MNYLVLFFSLLFLATSSETATIVLTVEHIEDIKGNIEIALFSTGERFLEEGQAYKNYSIEVKDNSETIELKDLPKGTYAIAIYHDKNSNGECDRNFLGIPKEPYGFSNNFRPKFSKPTFEDCQFTLDSDQSMRISLKK